MPVDYEKKLKELSGKLMRENKKIDNAMKIRGQATKELNTLKSKISDTQKIISDINRVLLPYNQAFQKVEEDLNSFKVLSIAMTQIVNKIQKEKKKTVEKIMAKVDSQINPPQDKIRERNEYESAKTEHQNAEEDIKDKQVAYDNLKKIQTDINNNIEELTTLKTLLEKEKSDKNNEKIIYFLIKEINCLYGKTNDIFKTQGAFESEVSKKWYDLNKAKSTLREKEVLLKTAVVKWKRKQSELNASKKERRQLIMKKL